MTDSYTNPEQEARREIDKMLEAAGWVVQSRNELNLFAGSEVNGVALREVTTKAGPADYILFVAQRPIGVIEAKKSGTTLSGVEPQTLKYQGSVPDELPARLVHGILPFGYESTGVETFFTNHLDPEPTARHVFGFHRPETLFDFVDRYEEHGLGTFRARVHDIPPLDPEADWLRPAQRTAIINLEQSLRDNRPRALVQMATGAGKTFTAANIAYRLLAHAGARKILFLVDRSNLGRQTLKEFQAFEVPGTGHKFSELYNVNLLGSNQVNESDSVCIATIQRVYSMLRGEAEFDEAAEDAIEDATGVVNEPGRPVEVAYNPAIPIETFDAIVIDECHRSIFGVWRQVLDYFDAHLIGLTATPGKQAFGFFNNNLVMEYGFPQAVADRVNVDFDVFRLSTAISESGSTIDAGYFAGFRDRETREERFERIDEDIEYDSRELDRRVVAKDQIRTVAGALRDNLPAMFPDRDRDERGRLVNIPKTLIFAKDDSHAEDIVRIAREEFGKGNEAIAKITYKSSDGSKPEELLQAFRNSYNPRIAVTVDMIATGTDVKPIECVVFMRMVRSRSFFEQMKGRGVRVIGDDDLKAVTPDATHKDRFVLVDAVGVTESDLVEVAPLERKRGVPFGQLLQQIALGQVSEAAVSSLASRIARLRGRIGEADVARLDEIAGQPLDSIEHALVAALDPDRFVAAAKEASGTGSPSDEDVERARQQILIEAVKPIASNPKFREELMTIQKTLEQVIDEISADVVTRAEFAVDAKARAQNLVTSFQEYIEAHKDEITALQVLYSKPYSQRLKYSDVKELANEIGRPPRSWTPEQLWEAYETLDASKVRGSGIRTLTNIVSLVRFAIGEEDELEPYADHVSERFEGWLLQQQNAGRTFSAEQLEWLRLIRDHLASSLEIEPRELTEVPFSARGGLQKARTLFGDELDVLLEELTEAVAA